MASVIKIGKIIRTKVDKINLIKITHLCSSEYRIKMLNLENLLSKHKTNNLLSRIYNERLKVSKERTNNSVGKWA